MRVILLITTFILFTAAAFSQTTINGVVKNKQGKPIPDAVVTIEGSTDIALTGIDGTYSLLTYAVGKQKITVEKESVEVQVFEIDIQGETMQKDIVVVEDGLIEEIIISAGSIKASNDRTVAILDPLDIVTTAGGQGDIAGAIQTLPGVQRNGGDQTGIMVRGGDVNEAAVIIDGMIAQNAFNSSVPGVGQRTRFNPFQFKGTAFSTGGYTARYGQAMSAVLDLSTNDLPDQSNMNIGANFAGVYVSGSKLMENKNAVEFSTNYTNLSPFFLLTKPNVDFFKVPQGFGFSGRYVAQTPTLGMFKTTVTQSYNATGIEIVDPADPSQKLKFGLANENTYVNTSYRDYINNSWSYYTALSLSSNTDNIAYDVLSVYRHDERVQARGEMNYNHNVRFRMMMGSEVQRYTYTQKFDTLVGQFSELLSAVYAEADILPLKRIAIKPGIRAEYSQLLAKGNISPRFAAAIKTSKHSQISLATGMFYQTAGTTYLLQGYRPGFQHAVHYMANYQVIAKDRIFRIEGYYKSYDQLVREKGTAYTPNQFRFDLGEVDNSGSGYAQGIDFFFRDKKTVENLDYWISYSYIDTKRLYQNYIDKVTPDYISDHNLNLVMKYFWMKAQTNFSATYSYASGRPYYNPNSERFLSDRAPAYQNLALTISYLTTIKKMFAVVYLSMDNITNNKNVLGYRYSLDGSQSYAIQPPFYFNVFLGINLSLQEFNKDEL
jgi:hypothetical protein